MRDAMTRRQFSSVWATLGVDVEPALVDALFNKYGHTAQGLMPVNVSSRARRRNLLRCLSV